ncbi:hypothetical protein Tco_1203478 [Tanacetum coccineum]
MLYWKSEGRKNAAVPRDNTKFTSSSLPSNKEVEGLKMDLLFSKVLAVIIAMMDRKDLFETKAKERSDRKAKEKILVLIPETTFVGVLEITFVGVESRVFIPETTFVGVESRVLIPETTVWDTLVYPSDTLVIRK